MVECRTPEREVRGSRPTAAVLCPWARHFTPRKYWLITQEAMAPSRHDWKIVDWDVKPQHNQPTNPSSLSSIIIIIHHHYYPSSSIIIIIHRHHHLHHHPSSLSAIIIIIIFIIIHHHYYYYYYYHHHIYVNPPWSSGRLPEMSPKICS